MKKLVLLLVLLPASLNAIAHLTPGYLTKEIKSQGARAVISELYANEEEGWQYVTTQISKGENSWLDVASQLAPGTDAASAETLSSAVALAIPHNPAGVINILTEKYQPLSRRQVCSLPFYQLTEAQFNQYVLDAIRTLYKIPDGKTCLAIMTDTIGQSAAFNVDN
ncbi:hypothetical protein COO59_09505 [Mixta theicola]|uniref:Uncharacterized protein n=1 Tax=Mixta theicola TaxID=1458355 RepID=A0A2K1Q9K8_9GAMM|nr:hypothetical protein [Mixta theicola]PNS11728.1 hypothetical protein COO59_09505 [Mixta theicola]GLR07642.1 hypothetical protein GCM10007905_03610 [Mixta theicola]